MTLSHPVSPLHGLGKLNSPPNIYSEVKLTSSRRILKKMAKSWEKSKIWKPDFFFQIRYCLSNPSVIVMPQMWLALRCNITIFHSETYQKGSIKTSSASHQVLQLRDLTGTNRKWKMMDELWPEWDLYAAQSLVHYRRLPWRHTEHIRCDMI